MNGYIVDPVVLTTGFITDCYSKEAKEFLEGKYEFRPIDKSLLELLCQNEECFRKAQLCQLARQRQEIYPDTSDPDSLRVGQHLDSIIEENYFKHRRMLNDLRDHGFAERYEKMMMKAVAADRFAYVTYHRIWPDE